MSLDCFLINIGVNSKGELAQSGRAPALQAGCQRFESAILHSLFANSEYCPSGEIGIHA